VLFNIRSSRLLSYEVRFKARIRTQHSDYLLKGLEVEFNFHQEVMEAQQFRNLNRPLDHQHLRCLDSVYQLVVRLLFL
jgi:hypothetical protein